MRAIIMIVAVISMLAVGSQIVNTFDNINSERIAKIEKIVNN